MSIRTAASRVVVRGGLAQRVGPVSAIGRRNASQASPPPPGAKKEESGSQLLIIGGVVAAAGLGYYFVSQSADKNANEVAKQAKKERPVNTEESGNTAQPVGGRDSKDMGDAIKQAMKADAPKSAYKDEEQKAKFTK